MYELLSLGGEKIEQTRKKESDDNNSVCCSFVMAFPDVVHVFVQFQI